MLFTRSTFIGIDPAAGRGSVAYAALDGELKPLALGRGRLAEALAFAGGQQEAWAAVHGPSGYNRGLMADKKRRAALDPAPKPGQLLNLRLAEYEILRQRLPIYKTPRTADGLRGWQKTALRLHEQLDKLGYKASPRGAAKRRRLESAPDLCYRRWLGRAPFYPHSIEGRLQRQIVLYDLGVQVADPMNFFEEVTRHRLLQGILPDEMLYRPAELNALALAALAWLAANRPEEVEALGDKQEGQVTLPQRLDG
ncbi:MAG: hypothetical protein HYZ26_05360 [Chloroflexi bacterium]|nr:hypothetical protein [Chloroflexota bacterium]